MKPSPEKRLTALAAGIRRGEIPLPALLADELESIRKQIIKNRQSQQSSSSWTD